jgi:hypothetical protein
MRAPRNKNQIHKNKTWGQKKLNHTRKKCTPKQTPKKKFKLKIYIFKRTNQPTKQTNKSGCEKKHEKHTRFAAV